MRLLFTFHSFLILISAQSQNCETIVRSDFLGYPDSLPESVNCFDKNKLKQGYWINSDNLTSNNTYSYGEYLDGDKIGVWIYRINEENYGEHLTPILRVDTFIRYKDSVIVKSASNQYFSSLNWNYTKSVYDKDSLKLFINHKLANSRFEFTIKCSSDTSFNQQCKLEYRNTILSTFPIQNIDLEIDRLNLFYYGRKIKEIEDKE